MISIVYWLYRDDTALRGGKRVYTAEHVNAQLPMLAKYCGVPYRVVCIADDPTGLDPIIEHVPPPVTSDGPVISVDPRYPRCYRRLWNWSHEARMLGDRIFSLDVDSILTRDITPILERDEDLVVWRGPSGSILGAAYLLRTASHPYVWETFDFHASPVALLRAGVAQSDQGWLNYILPPGIAFWTERDGLYVPPLGDPRPLPDHVRLVSFGGLEKPWMPEAHKRYPWILDHYR